MLPTFPSRYWSTIGLPIVFSLAAWSPQLQTGFHVSRPTQVASSHASLSRTGLSPPPVVLSRTVPVRSTCFVDTPTTPNTPQGIRFRLFPFRSPLLRASMFLSFPAGTKMFQFPAFPPSSLMVTGLQPAGFPHSDMRGSIPVCRSPRLFAAYHVLRRLRKPRHPPFALVLFLVNHNSRLMSQVVSFFCLN